MTGARLATLLTCLLLSACGSPAEPTAQPSSIATAGPSDGGAPEPSVGATAQTSPAAPSATPSTTPTADRPSAVPSVAPAEHRIGVRVVDGQAEFYDRTSDERWVPRGFNHWQWTMTGGYLMDRTFRVGDNGLEQAHVDLRAMGAMGYNAVRIWANACFGEATGCMGEPSGGLRPSYLENMAEYLRAARDAGLAVMFTFDHLPDDGGYGVPDAGPDWDGFNVDLTERGISVQERFWGDFVSGLQAVGAPMDAIWAYQLRNEQFYEAQLPPFSTRSTVTAADGVTYDLADPEQARAMRASNLRLFADRVSAAIKAVDPTALVTMGFFPSAEGPVAVPPDARLVDPRPLVDSGLDFLDFHAYPGVGLDWDQAWANSLLAGVDQVPVILGEYGAFSGAYADPVDAAAVMVDHQARACRDGLDGFLYWTWAGQGTYNETWGASETTIAEALSPGTISDACDPGRLPHPNLAFGGRARASSFEDGPEIVGTPSKAFDLSENTWWSSGRDAPQWISVELGGATVERVRLYTEQATDGPMETTVRLLAGNGRTLASHVFRTDRPGGNLELEHTFDRPLDDVDRLRVDTARGGWVIWYEIEAYGPAGSAP